MKKITLLSFALILSTFGYAQDNDKSDELTKAHISNFRDWAVSIGIGNMYMQGDLASWAYNPEDGSYGDFDFGPTLQLGVTKYTSTTWGFALSADIGTMAGSSWTNVSLPQDRNLPRFEMFYFNINPQVVFNLSGLGLRGKTSQRKWAHLMKAGIGVHYGQVEFTYVNASNQIVTDNVDGDGDESWNNSTHVNLDYNLKYQLTKSFDLDVLVGGRFFFTDNIEGYGNGFPVYSEFNNKENDLTIYTGIGATYNWGNRDDDAESNDKIAAIYANPMDDMYAELESIRDDYDKLTGDDDDDGVSNYFDKDNETPEGATVNGDGVASDVDEDGIPDYLDKDPFTIKGAQVDEDGVAIDTDKDGVPDVMDEEADTEEGALVNFKGITIPTSSFGGSGKGGAASAMLPAFFFNFNSATVTAANYQRMLTLVKVLEANPELNITLRGFADIRGAEAYNQKLGQRRAEEVKKELVQVYGIDASRISTDSKGENTPYAKNRYDINRRVDVIVD